MGHNELMQALADYYPLEDLLIQNDIEPIFIIKYLVDEGLIDLEDYYYEDVDEETDVD